jgi:hypothetical protein
MRDHRQFDGSQHGLPLVVAHHFLARQRLLVSLRHDVRAIGLTPAMVFTREKMGVVNLVLMPEKSAAFFMSDYERWGTIVKAPGYRAEE